MCKLLFGIQFNQSAEFEKLIRLQETDLKHEKDGIGAFILRPDEQFQIYRDLEDYDRILRKTYQAIPTAKMVGLHTRTGTSGLKNLMNVHFFQNAQYVFAHNGFAHSYAKWPAMTRRERKNYLKGQKVTMKTTGYLGAEKLEAMDLVDVMCDSYQMMANLSHPLSLEMLGLEMEDAQFSGVAVLVDKVQRRCFLLTTRDIKVHTDFQNYIIFYSWASPETKSANVRSMAGFPIMIDSKVNHPLYEMATGVYEFPFDIASTPRLPVPANMVEVNT